MTNKLSELSKPVAQAYYDEHDSSTMRIDWLVDYAPEAAVLYSQEYVSALLAELEAKDEPKDVRVAEIEKRLKQRAEDAEERIAELERANQSQDDHINQQQDRIDSLEKTNTGLGRRLGEAEKRLASPIKIVNYDEFFICHVTGASDDYCKGWVDGRNAAARDVGKAGFTVEGDE
ncbi:hypothetical protein [Serratia liquefaciens]|uniref:hypothetical protein n=1 Tax=Serratia liquefaciens TaxID=614 RepID=UPI003817D2C2